jgi:hypothetical protein
MKGITGRPTAGARLVLEKAEEEGGAAIYRGVVHLPDADVAAEARVDLAPPEGAAPGSAVKVTLGPGGTGEMERWVAALVRAATKGGGAAGGGLTRKIVRWRG